MNQRHSQPIGFALECHIDALGKAPQLFHRLQRDQFNSVLVE